MKILIFSSLLFTAFHQLLAVDDVRSEKIRANQYFWACVEEARKNCQFFSNTEFFAFGGSLGICAAAAAVLHPPRLSPCST
jgi:hypothetical protein